MCKGKPMAIYSGPVLLKVGCAQELAGTLFKTQGWSRTQYYTLTTNSQAVPIQLGHGPHFE